MVSKSSFIGECRMNPVAWVFQVPIPLAAGMHFPHCAKTSQGRLTHREALGADGFNCFISDLLAAN